MERFEYTDTNKRYHTWSYYTRKKYGCKVYKIPVNIGVTCPNRDGTKGIGGCAFCSESGSGEFGGDRKLSVTEQIARGRKTLSLKGRDGLRFAYFQSYSNTYGDVNYLRKVYDEALACGVDGIVIATRPDCLGADITETLAALARKTDLTVELGLQTARDDISQALNRGTTYAECVDAHGRLRDVGIKTGVHIIDGLPDETAEDMLETARRVAALAPDLVKIHMLYIVRDSALGKAYSQKPFPLLTREEYTDVVCRQLELLPPQCVIERLTGDGDKSKVIAPKWTCDKLKNLNAIDVRLAETDTFQGKKYIEEQR